jgi:PLP dependent protein
MAARSELKDRYHMVMQRVAEAAARVRRRSADIVVVAVTKTAGVQQLRQLIDLGHTDLGENRAQHLQQRVAMTEEFLSRRRLVDGRSAGQEATIRWHMVGHLQRNKVRGVLPMVKLIHSVDSLRLAEEIQIQTGRLDRDADVLLQVNVAGEGRKFGLAPAAVGHLVEQMQTMTHVRVRGLMTMAPYAEDPQASRICFQRCAELFEEIRDSGRAGREFNLLSMGMSNDFEVAIECGANVVRIGRALFGEGAEANR